MYNYIEIGDIMSRLLLTLILCLLAWVKNEYLYKAEKELFFALYDVVKMY